MWQCEFLVRLLFLSHRSKGYTILVLLKSKVILYLLVGEWLPFFLFFQHEIFGSEKEKKTVVGQRPKPGTQARGRILPILQFTRMKKWVPFLLDI